MIESKETGKDVIGRPWVIYMEDSIVRIVSAVRESHAVRKLV